MGMKMKMKTSESDYFVHWLFNLGMEKAENWRARLTTGSFYSHVVSLAHASLLSFKACS